MKIINTFDELNAFTGMVLFSAPWCKPCTSYKPALVAFCQRSDIPLAMVDIDKSRPLAGAVGIRAVPTTCYVDRGTEFSRLTGAQTDSSLQRMVPA